MEDNKKIFIRGSKKHGDKAIEYLRELSNGGVFNAWNGLSDNCIYFIDYNNNICCLRQEDGMAKIVMDCYTEVTINDILAYFAEKEDRWDYDGKHNVKGYWITSMCRIAKINTCAAVEDNRNIFATEEQVKSALAMSQISQYMANDKRYGGIITDKEWYNDCMEKYTIIRSGNTLKFSIFHTDYQFLAFHTKEQRDLFLKEHEDLVKDYLMIK